MGAPGNELLIVFNFLVSKLVGEESVVSTHNTKK